MYLRIAKEQCEEVSELRSSQEEADTHLYFSMLFMQLNLVVCLLLSLLRTQMVLVSMFNKIS